MTPPLLRSERAQMTVGLLLIAVGLASALYVLARVFAADAVFDDDVVVNGGLVAGILLTLAAPTAAWAVIAPERPTPTVAAVKLTGVALTGVGLALAAVLAIRQAIHDLNAQERFGVASEDIAVWLLFAAVAALVIGAMVAVVRWPASRRMVLAGVVVAGAIGLLGVGTAATVATTVDACEAFRFDPQRWKEARATFDPSAVTSPLQPLSDAIVRCGVVDGADQATVERLLGAADEVGTAPDAGLGDPRTVWEYRIGVIPKDMEGSFTGALTLGVVLDGDGQVVDVAVQEGTASIPTV